MGPPNKITKPSRCLANTGGNATKPRGANKTGQLNTLSKSDSFDQALKATLEFFFLEEYAER